MNMLREALAKLDVPMLRRLWAQIAPHLPQPTTDLDALRAAHVARTQTQTLTTDQRAYSHAWLRERDLPSMLPDHEKQSAERLYPRIAPCVGLSVNCRDPELQGVSNEIRKAMEYAVLDAEAEGRLTDSLFVLSRTKEASARRKREIYGRTGFYALRK